MGDVRDQTVAGFKWNAIGQVSAKAVNFALGLMIARMLMPEDYGVIGMLAIFVSIAQAFVDIACSTHYMRKLLGVRGREYRNVVRYFLLSVVACVPAYMICCLDLSPWIALPVAVMTATGIYWLSLHKDQNMKEFLEMVRSGVQGRINR